MYIYIGLEADNIVYQIPDKKKKKRYLSTNK